MSKNVMLVAEIFTTQLKMTSKFAKGCKKECRSVVYLIDEVTCLWMADVGRCKQTIIITDVNFIRSISSHPSKKTQTR